MKIAVRLFVFGAIAVLSLWSQNSSGTVASNTRVSAVPATATYSGMVMMEDGSRVPGSVDIKITCNGSERTVTHTTVNDDFQFQWVRGAQVAPVTGNSFANPMTGANSDASSVVRASMSEQSGFCELRAWLPGYRSSEINLENYPAFDGTSVGVLWLTSVSGHPEQLVSALTLRAPAEARKLFDKGVQYLGSGNFSAAVVSFQKAVSVYPQYADAWLDLGKTQFDMGETDAAASSLQRAIALDSRMPGAWQMLGYVAFNQQKWTDAADYLSRAEQLDPLNSPTPWFYSAVAYFKLQKYDQAEKSIRAEIDMDPQFRMVRARYVLGVILIARHNTTQGSDTLRNYLAASPDPRDVAPVQAALARMQNEAGY